MSARNSNPLVLLRNIGISAHVDAGKTTLTERFLYYAGDTHKMGNVDSGDTVTDFMKQERDRGITICSAAVTCKWLNSVINLIDTPGHVDFTMEVERSMRVLDGTVIVLCAKGGVQPQTKTVWRQADRYRVPRILFINKMDTMGANFQRVVDQVHKELKARTALLELPIGEADTFRGVIDLLAMKALIWDASDATGETFSTEDIPAELLADAEAARATLVEAIVEGDDALLERYLEGEELSIDELKKALRQAVVSMRLMPVLCGSAFKKKGVQPLLDAVVNYLPSPLEVPHVKGILPDGSEGERQTADSEPLASLAFKVVDDPHGDLIFVRVYSGVLEAGSYALNSRTNRNERIGRLVRLHGNKRTPVERLTAGDIGAVIGLKDTITGDTLCSTDKPIKLETINCPDPVISKAIEAKDKDGQQRLAQALERMRRADPSFRVFTDPETNQVIIAGLGELHLDIKQELLREIGIETKAGEPQVSYRETIRGRARQDTTFKRQNGGHGMFANVVIEIEPLPNGEGFEFEDATVGGSVPKEYIGSVEKGVRSALSEGVLAGFPVVGVKVTLVDGKSHDVDSSDMAFQLAGSMAFKEAFKKATPTLLEPVMALEVVIPAKHMGDVIGDVAKRRGRVAGTDIMDETTIVKAEVPLSTTFGYSNTLRGATSGEGTFSMEFLRYEAVPAEVAKEIVERVAGNE
jgi:elongation factor G